MATYITVQQQAGQQLLEANAKQTAVNRAGLKRSLLDREAKRLLGEGNNILLDLGKEKVIITGRRRSDLPDEELAATRRKTPVDVLMIKLRWTTGADYDLNVGFAQAIQNPGGLALDPDALPNGYEDYVGWTFAQRYMAHNFMYHAGDNTDPGESGEAYEVVFIDLTRQRSDMPAWVDNKIILELRSYWYEEAATSELLLDVFPVRLAGTALPFDPASLEAEVLRFTELGFPYKKSLLFSTNVGTNKQGGNLGELIATIPINLATQTWKLERYQAVA